MISAINGCKADEGNEYECGSLFSHYPPDKYFLQLCDSLGIYVLDELSGWQKFYSTKAGEPLVKEMVLRDMNHPSIIFWDNGNEGGTNKELDDDFVKWDFQNALLFIRTIGPVMISMALIAITTKIITARKKY